MVKKLTISILAALLLSTVSSGANGVDSRKLKPLMDGSVLAGVDGKVNSADSNESSQYPRLDSVAERWFFEIGSDVSDGKARICAGTRIELLPSSALEKLTADVKERTGTSYRLWGRVTKYDGRNFIFPNYFLPLSKARQSEPSQSQQTQTRLTINEPNDTLTIPDEIIAKLASRKIVRPGQLRKLADLKEDSILADRVGFIVRRTSGEVVFVPDALGRNVGDVSLRLLPCEVLERAELTQSSEPEPLRFKTAGIVTQYKGRYYLLLHRAARVYSHGNFPG